MIEQQTNEWNGNPIYSEVYDTFFDTPEKVKEFFDTTDLDDINKMELYITEAGSCLKVQPEDLVPAVFSREVAEEFLGTSVVNKIKELNEEISKLSKYMVYIQTDCKFEM